MPIYWLARLIGATVRLEVEGLPELAQGGRGQIFAGWHGRTFLATKLFRNKGIWTIISTSRDGQAQNRIFSKFGFRTIRGSSSRGGAKVLIESIRILKTGATLAFTPDGPRGPTHIVQDGVIAMGQKARAVIVPVGVSASRRWLLPTWDSYMIPKPFSRAVMIFGPPIEVPEKPTAEEFETIRTHLEREINRVEHEAELRMGHSS